MQVEDIRVFIPSKDFEISKAFYAELGFQAEEVNDDLTVFENGSTTFFLQRYFNKTFAENLMFQLIVTDIDEAYSCISNIRGFDFRFEPIKKEPWGNVIYLWGPSGELWHVTQLLR
jgi:hypothetical protein